MTRRPKLSGIALLGLAAAGAGGGVSPGRADEFTRIEVGVGDLRGEILYRTPVTRIENVEEPFAVNKDVHFCSDAGGGEEWNSPAYDPPNSLIFTGDVDWCVTVRLQAKEEIAAAPLGQPWTGEKSLNPFNEFGKFTRADADGIWAGWL
jgi:alcohol dehydrogenase (cytochrome c)